MRFFKPLLLSLACTTGAQAQVLIPESVQGVPYAASLRANASTKALASTANVSNPQSTTAVDKSEFSFDMIKSWAGEGANKAGLIIQWNTGQDSVAYVFGYQWDGAATGNEMLEGVAKANPRLYILADKTAYGMTIYGIGWDADNAGKLQIQDGKGNVYEADESGVIYVSGASSSADAFTPVDENDYWSSGWYKGYWSYWLSDSGLDSFKYASVGASSRKLTDGCWDGWNFAVNMQASAWKPFEAAPSPIPDGVKTEFYADGLYFNVKSYSRRTVTVAAPMELDGVAASAYTGAITIPATVKCDTLEYQVVAIDNAAFEGTSITSVTLPETVTSIGNLAFEGCTSLASINITDHITSIGSYAFMGCSSLKQVAYPTAVTAIADGTYYGSGIQQAILPEWITAVGESAFAACPSLTTVELPATLKSVGDKAFAESDAITAIKACSTRPVALTDSCFSAAIYSKATVTVPMGYIETYKAANEWKNFSNYTEYMLPVAIGDCFKYNGVTYQVTALGKENTAKITYCETDGGTVKAANTSGYVGDLEVPEIVEFQGEKLKVTEMNDSAFFYATQLTSLKLPATLKSIPARAFYTCQSLQTVNIPDSVTTIDEYAFYGCAKLENMTIPEAVTTIGKYAFYGNTVATSYKLPEGLTSLGDHVFYNCSSLKEANIPVGITSLPAYTYYGCKALEQVELGDQITAIDTYAFSDCSSLKSIKLPNAITELPNYCFQNCSSLTTLEIPTSVTKIGNYTFKNCTNLNIDIPSQITSLGTNVFYGCSSLTRVVLPTTITAVPVNAFYGCKALTDVTLHNNVTSIGNYAFNECTSLTHIKVQDQDVDSTVTVLPSSLTAIGNYAFSNVKLPAVELPEGLLTIGTYAFNKNTALTSLVLPSTMTALSSNYMFFGCTDLTVYIQNPVPVKTVTNAFKYSSSAYVKVVVPTGTKAAYDASSTYWKNIAVTEPEVTASFAEATEATVTTSSATVNATLKLEYADNIPAKFIASNNAVIVTDATMQVACDKAGSLSDNASTVDATADSEGVYTATISDLQAGTAYEYQWHFTSNYASWTSAVQEFTTDISTGIADINASAQAIRYQNGVLTVKGYTGSRFTVVNMAGAVCASFVCDCDSYEYPLALAAGVYAVHSNDNGGNAVKFVVR